MGRHYFIAALLLLGAAIGGAYAAATFSSLPNASQPLTGAEIVPMDQGLTTVKSPSARVGQPVQTNCASIGSPFQYQWCIDTSVNPPILKAYVNTTWTPLGEYDTNNGIWTPPIGGAAVTTLAGAATTNLGSVPQSSLTISGNATITSFGSSAVTGTIKILTFSGNSVLTYNASSLILPGLANITTSAGDTAAFIALGSGRWRGLFYQRASGGVISGPFYAATNAALQAIPSTAFPAVFRGGFSSAGDGGAMWYVSSNSACSAADNGSQVTAADGNCWIWNRAGMMVTPMVFGAAGDGVTDDTTPIANAIIALATGAGNKLYAGPHIYSTGAQTINTGLLWVIGENGNLGTGSALCTSGFKAKTTNLTLFTFSAYAAGAGGGGGIRDTCIQMAGLPNTNTAGSAISLTGIEENVNNVYIVNSCNGVSIVGSNNGVSNSRIEGVAHGGCAGVSVGKTTTLGSTIDPYIRNTVITCNQAAPGDAGISVNDAGGLLITGGGPGDNLYCSDGVDVFPGANQHVIGFKIIGGFTGDSYAGTGLNFETLSGSATIEEGEITNCWLGGNSLSSGPGIRFADSGANGTLRGIHISECAVYANGKQGIDAGYGTELTFDQMRICGNSVSGATLYHGVNWGVVGLSRPRLTNSIVSSQCDGVIAGTQGNAMFFSGAVTDAIITNNDFKNNGLTAYGSSVLSPVLGSSVIINNMGIDDGCPSVNSAATVTLPINPVICMRGNTNVTTINGMWNGRQVRLVTLDNSGGITYNGLCDAPAANAVAYNHSLFAVYDPGAACIHAN